jgi:hypothetical protein
MAESRRSGSEDRDVPLQDLSNTLSRTETVNIPPDEFAPASPNIHQRNISESSGNGRPPNGAARQDSRASINYFSQRYRGSQSSGRSPSLTPAETYHFVQARRSNSIAAAISSPTGFSHDEAAVTDDGVEEIDDPELQTELATIVDSMYGPPIPTTQCIQNFKKVVARQIDPAIQEAMDRHLAESKAERKRHNETLKRLRKWSERKNTQTIFLSRLGRLGNLFARRAPLPKHEELVSLAKHYFPLRADVKLYVCDFGENKFNKEEVPLGMIDSCMLYLQRFMISIDIRQT